MAQRTATRQRIANGKPHKVTTTTTITANLKTPIQTTTNTIQKWLLLAIPAFLVTAWSLTYLIGDPSRNPGGDPGATARIANSPLAKLHMSGGALGACLGPFQFLTPLRRAQPTLHRWLGRVYNAGIVLGGLFAFRVTFDSTFLNWWGVLGYCALATAWMGATAVAMGYILGRERDVQRHKEWMMRSFALTYAAVSLRVQMPVLMAWGWDATMAVSFQGWACWVPNLVVVEMLIMRDKAKKAVV